MVVAHAIAQIDGDRRGIHVLFSGPPGWIYAPAGWELERRVWQRAHGPRACANLSDAALSELRRERELETPIGLATLRHGSWVHPAGGPPRTAEVLTVDLRAPTTFATVSMPGPNWTAYGLRAGKVVVAAPAQTAPGQVTLTASAIDRVVVHAQHADAFQVCSVTDTNTTSGWSPIAHLQLPLREVDPSLGDEAAEWNRARSRLIPGDALDQATFAELASTLRTVAPADGARPIDGSIRPDPESPDTVLGALDPLRLALLDPAVRRALGLAHFDDDPALQPGEIYQYRVTAKFPPDAALPRAGFQTVPVGTHVPPDFFFGDVRVRLSQPSQVELVPTGAVGDVVVGRRAIAVAPRESPHWLLPDLLDAALVLDFAVPRSAIVLDLADQVGVRYEAFDADGGLVASGDPGDGALTFAGQVARIVLRGRARWLGLRDAQPAGAVAMFTITAPVVFAEPPPPPPPLSITATTAGLNTQSTPEQPQPRSELGFDVVWRPPLAFDANAWPPDADAAPPLEATRFELEHEQAGEGFEPVFGPGGQAFGDRSSNDGAPVTRGADLMVVFPEQPPPPVGAVDEFAIRDHFVRDPEIPPPVPGTDHRYRIRALDEIGRPSAWLTSASALLEKRFPPPPPVGPPSPAGPGRLAGVRARVLVRDAPDLTAAEQHLLDEQGSTSAIVLTWGWTEEQRSLDPWTREFRVYKSSGGIGPIHGRVTAVTDSGGGRFTVQLTLDRPAGADAASGGYLPAGGEYRILTHGAGSSIQATVETLVPAEDGTTFPPPRLGPTIVPVRLASAQSRPEAWEERIQVVPLTEESVYEIVLRDLLLPSPGASQVAVWLGVSAADAEPYVDDSFPGGGRPGNESPLVALRCEARYHGRPELDVPPPIGDVPAVATARATADGVQHDLDLLPFLADTGLAPGELAVVEQLSDGDLLAAVTVDGTDVVAIPPPAAPRDADDVPIGIPNPGDRTAITEALTSDPLALADRYVVWLAARHPFADWLFAPVQPVPHVLGQPVRLSLPAGGARYVARVRRVDAAGHRSAGAATCAVVVRVPVLAPLAPPTFLGAEWTATPDGPRVELRSAVPDERTTHLLTWVAAADPRRAELASVGSRRDLPGFGIRLRALDGASLTPSVVPLDGDVVPDPETGARVVTTVEDPGAGPHFVWLAVVDRDGVPSRLAGAYRLPARVG